MLTDKAVGEDEDEEVLVLVEAAEDVLVLRRDVRLYQMQVVLGEYLQFLAT